MNHYAKFDAASYILSGESRNRTYTHTKKQTNKRTNKQTNKQTVNDISTPCVSSCVDNKLCSNSYSYSKVTAPHSVACSIPCKQF